MKHKPGIVDIQFPEETLSDTNPKLQSVCRTKIKNSRSQINIKSTERAWQRPYIINCKPPLLFTERNCRDVFWEAVLVCKGYLWATEIRQTCLQRLWPSKPSDWHKEHELHLSSLLFAWGFMIRMFCCFDMGTCTKRKHKDFLLVKVTALADSNSECHWQQKMFRGSKVSVGSWKLFKPAMCCLLPRWSSGCVVSRFLT